MVIIMYVIMVYDVGVERVAKVLKIGRKYLTWIQNSVLEGQITDANLIRLKEEINSVIEKEDSVILFSFKAKYELKVVLGISKNEPDIFV